MIKSFSATRPIFEHFGKKNIFFPLKSPKHRIFRKLVLVMLDCKENSIQDMKKPNSTIQLFSFKKIVQCKDVLFLYITLCKLCCKKINRAPSFLMSLPLCNFLEIKKVSCSIKVLGNLKNSNMILLNYLKVFNL